MARGMGILGTLISGWWILLLSGFVFGFKIIPIVIILCIIYIIGIIVWKWIESTDPPETEPEVIVYDFDNYDVGELPAYVPEPSKPIVPDNIIEDAISALRKLGTQQDVAKEAVVIAVENGANTLEQIIKQSFQILYSK